MNTIRQVLMYQDEESTWVVECPSLPGCISQGPTGDEALRNIQEAIRAYVAALEEDHLVVPEERFETMLVAV
jgi:predicted RNase H-like HicB family nuclease